MTQTNAGAYEQLSDETLMHRYFELSDQPDKNAAELAAVGAAIQARLFAQYGVAEGAAPRIRTAASI